MQTLQYGYTLQGGKYIIKQVLGQGGFGITYLAEHKFLGTNVAIKEFFMQSYCLRDSNGTSMMVSSSNNLSIVGRYYDKFLKEARNIASLNHSNIVRINDVFEENGTAYYVMEYCNRGSLASLMKHNPNGLKEEIAVRYIQQIARALDYIHGKHMCHLDVKPENILLNNNDEIVLIDFGISKCYDVEGNQKTSTPVGISEGYAPVEQYRQGGVQSFSPETDIYALGATMYKLLTGKNPLPATDIINGGVLPMYSVSDNNKKLIAKAMHPIKKDRISSISLFLAELNRTQNVITMPKEETVPLCHYDNNLIKQVEHNRLLSMRQNMVRFSNLNKSVVLTHFRKDQTSNRYYYVWQSYACLFSGCLYADKDSCTLSVDIKNGKLECIRYTADKATATIDLKKQTSVYKNTWGFSISKDTWNEKFHARLSGVIKIFESIPTVGKITSKYNVLS